MLLPLPSSALCGCKPRAVTGISDTSMQSAISAAVTLVRFLCCMFSLPFFVIYMLIAICKHIRI